MKKGIVLCAVCLSVLLVACGAPQAAQATPAPVVATPAPVSLPDPLETDAEGLVLATGISLPVPADAADVRYSYWELPDEAPLAQVDFTLDGAALCLRAKPYGELQPDDISGLSYDWSEIRAAQVRERPAVLATNDEAGYIAWVDAAPGLLYSLSMTRGASEEKLTALAELVFTPLQGDSGPEESAPEQFPEAYGEYRELITQIALGLERGWISDLVTEVGISEVFRTAERETYGWLMADVNRDGVDELLFGKLTPEEESSPFYDIYSMLNGEMIHVSTGWAYNYWYLLPDGVFINEWSGSGYDTYRNSYGLFNGKFIPANRSVDQSEYLHLDFQAFEVLD